MKLNWNFLGGQGVQNKKPSMWEVWIFSGTAHFVLMALVRTISLDIKTHAFGDDLVYSHNMCV